MWDPAPAGHAKQHSAARLPTGCRPVAVSSRGGAR